MTFFCGWVKEQSCNLDLYLIVGLPQGQLNEILYFLLSFLKIVFVLSVFFFLNKVFLYYCFRLWNSFATLVLESMAYADKIQVTENSSRYILDKIISNNIK